MYNAVAFLATGKYAGASDAFTSLVGTL